MLQQKTIKGTDIAVNEAIKELYDAGNAIISIIPRVTPSDYCYTSIIYNTPLSDEERIKFTHNLDMLYQEFENTDGFDGFEIHPLANVSKTPNNPIYEVIDNDGKADAWGVYIHTHEVGITCIAECDTEQTAIYFERMLLIAATKFIR